MITNLLDRPLFFGPSSSAVSSSLVPSKYMVALSGHTYMLDVKSDQWRHESIPLMRQSFFQATRTSEAALNPEGLWRRFGESWHHGAGQTYYDRDESDPFRFETSKGIDVWTRFQISLLPETAQKISSASTNLFMDVAGSRLYFLDNTAVKYTTDLSATTTVTSTGANAKLSICSDGFNVYFTDGSDVYSTNTGTTAAAVYNTLDTGGLAYVKGRLMAFGTSGTKNAIYNITSGTPPTALFTHANTDFTWVGFAEGQAAIYAAGYSGDKSLIYRISVKADASALDQPIIAGQLPDGEIIRSIGGYLGFIFVGSDSGWRFCVPDQQGNLNIGPLVRTTAAVRCWEGQDRFMWFGLSSYDSTSSGLGRADLTVETEPGALAYASDLMMTALASVQAVVTFLGLRVFTVSGNGIYAETTNKATSGTLKTGLITYGTPDSKRALFLDVRTSTLAGSYTVSLAGDDLTFVQIGSSVTALSTGGQFPAGEKQAVQYDVQFTLTRGAVATTGPTFNRWTLKITPELNDGPAEFLYVPLLLAQVLRTLDSNEVLCDVEAERDFIKSLRASGQIVQYQEGNSVYSVNVDDYQWKPSDEPNQDGLQNGTMLTKLKVLG